MDLQPKKQSTSTSSRPVSETVDDGSGKMTRISRQTRGLVDDVKSWVDLKMTLTQMDVEAKVDARVNQAVVGAAVGALGFLGLTFALVAAALGIGTWLEHDAWGFLIVAGVLLLITGVLLALKPTIVNVTSRGGQKKASNG